MSDKELQKIADNANTVLQKRGDLNDCEIGIIQKFIKENYLDMYRTWKNFGGSGFFGA